MLATRYRVCLLYSVRALYLPDANKTRPPALAETYVYEYARMHIDRESDCSLVQCELRLVGVHDFGFLRISYVYPEYAYAINDI
jgi:hypothetical protein